MFWIWFGFGGLTLAMIGLDLWLHRGGRGGSRKAAVTWTAVWIAAALAFSLFILARFGGEAAEEYLTTYVLEKSLSVDNLFVFLLLFATLRIPPAEQRKVLTWGVLGALVMRGLFIGAGALVLERWHFMIYVFGGILLWSAAKMLRHEEPGGSENRLIWILQRRLRLSRFAVAVLAVELTDLTFAVDSIPAAFAVTDKPFVIYSSNVFAILGLRSLYLVLAEALGKLRYLKQGLAAVLLVVGAKMLLSAWIHVEPIWPLLVILVILGVAVLASVLRPGERSGAT
jgi:predicted tellurium resistance membrane protein TerC